MAYGDKRDFRAIQIFGRTSKGEWHYICTSTWSRTCREAKAAFLEMYPKCDPASIRANFKPN